MKLVAEAAGVLIFAPDDGMVSFQASAYPAHVGRSAVDIFQAASFCTPAPSPVSGEIVDIDALKTGERPGSHPESLDYGIGIMTESGAVARTLHVKPCCEVGEWVRAGEPLGEYVRSGWVPSWSYPHAHVEVRHEGSSRRIQDSLPLTVMGRGSLGKAPEDSDKPLAARVKYAFAEFVVVEPESDLFMACGTFRGLACRVGEERGILDSDLPWNCYGGVVLGPSSRVGEGVPVSFRGEPLGEVETLQGGRAVYSFGGRTGDGIDRYSKGLLFRDVERYNVPRKRILVDGMEYLGVTAHLLLGETSELKLVPASVGIDRPREGDVVEIEFT